MRLLLKVLHVVALTGFLDATPLETGTKKLEESFCSKMKNDANFCMKYTLEYPIVHSEDKLVETHINTAIQQNISTNNAKEYVIEYKKAMEEQTHASQHSEDVKISLLSVTSHTFTLMVSTSSYTGGAHGNYGSSALNYDIHTGKIVSLEELFIPNYEEALKKIAEKAYRIQNALMPDEDLTQKMGWFENKFILPSSIGIGEDGLHLDYNPYEIRAYAYGTTELLVPYDMLSSLVKTDSYLSPLVSKKIKTSTNPVMPPR